MIRRAWLAAVVVLVALGSQAQAVEFDVQLWVDPDLTTYLWNTTDKDIPFDGYQIVSETNTLDIAGWSSIADRVMAGQGQDVAAQLGNGIYGFGEMSPTSAQVAEANISGVGVLKAGAKFVLGKPFGETGSVSDVMNHSTFFFKVGGIPQQFQNIIVPEPSTLLLATLAGFGLVAMRVRSKR
jgi:hypothetical protein